MWGRGRAATGAGAGTAAEAIVADISAQEIGGQVAVGSHNVQIHAEHGAIVTVAAPEQAAAVRAREVPVALLPRDAARLLGRERELSEALDALAAGEAVAFAGPAGVGKTTLLRRASHAGAATLEHGVVFARVAGQPVADVERFLFDAFYATDRPYAPPPAELRRRLADRRALVVLDDVEQERDDLCELLDAAPACRFLLAGERRCLTGEARELELGGLAAEAACSLLERELGRSLRDDERAPAAELCARLGGRPLALVQAAALAGDGALPSVADAAQLERSVRARLGEDERRVLRALELLAPATVHVDDVAAIAGVPDAAAVLERLRAAGAAQAHSPRWTATLAAGSAGDGAGDGAMLLRRARARLATDAAARPVEDVPAILAAMDGGPHAAGSGDRDVLALARAADPLLVRSGRWGAWGLALEQARRAAEASGDRAAAAWTLHQLGTRAGLLGDEAGGPRLGRALALRRALGDEAGAAVTAHNLSLLFGGPLGGGGPAGKPGPPRGPSAWRWLTAGGAGLALGVAAALAIASHGTTAATVTQAGRTQIRTTVVTHTVTAAAVTRTVTAPPVTQTVERTVTATKTVTAPGGRSSEGQPPPPPVRTFVPGATTGSG